MSNEEPTVKQELTLPFLNLVVDEIILNEGTRGKQTLLCGLLTYKALVRMIEDIWGAPIVADLIMYRGVEIRAGVNVEMDRMIAIPDGQFTFDWNGLASPKQVAKDQPFEDASIGGMHLA